VSVAATAAPDGVPERAAAVLGSACKIRRLTRPWLDDASADQLTPGPRPKFEIVAVLADQDGTMKPSVA
jgi:hypothetical protein